jgi:hypothetical protein
MVNARDESRSSLAYLNVKFGLWALLLYLAIGIGLEFLHGFKVSWYLQFETRRLMWTLGHAHGVLLSVLVIGFGMMLSVWHDAAARWPRLASACLMGATLLLPGGFLLGGAFVHGGDPGVGVFLSPVGGVLLFVGVALTAVKLRPPGEGTRPGSGSAP